MIRDGQSVPFYAEFRFLFSVVRGKFAERKIDQKFAIINATQAVLGLMFSDAGYILEKGP